MVQCIQYKEKILYINPNNKEPRNKKTISVVKTYKPLHINLKKNLEQHKIINLVKKFTTDQCVRSRDKSYNTKN